VFTEEERESAESQKKRKKQSLTKEGRASVDLKTVSGQQQREGRLRKEEVNLLSHADSVHPVH